MLRIKSFLCLLQAFLMLVSSFSVYDSKFKAWVDKTALGLTSVTDFGFEPISSEELKVTESEKQRCRKWFDENIRTAENPAYEFTVGGKKLKNSIDDWKISIGEESGAGEYYRNGKTSFITLAHKKSDLAATVEATIYEDYATCEWTVFIENTGSGNSPVIKNFYAADCDINTGISEVYFSRGSMPAADDFELLKSAVSVTPMSFNANGGRSGSWLPYWNICGKEFGVVTTNGWTGQWYTSIHQKLNGIHLESKQEFFSAYLTAGEKVRSPLVSLTFYENENAMKGFNLFRSWESDCVYTESAFPLSCTVLAGEFDRRNTGEYIEQINSYPEEACEATDFLWRDAGWYKINTSWYDSVGNWEADPERFPDGLAPIADAAEARGMKLLLWYEPERCCKNTTVYNECKKHEGWLIERSDEVNMVNLACDGAAEFLGNLVANSIKENHVRLYRQDFNFVPLEMWKEADKALWGGREGIEENHYVTNLYKYLDTLIDVNPGLIIDNCASGGKRLDVEMSRRSIPLWRTDYNCSDAEGKINDDCLEATQSASYGISFWLPLTGTGLNAYSEYADRTLIIPCSQRPGYEVVRRYMNRNYFPLCNGGLDRENWHAMQYGDENEGFAIIYRRDDVKSETYHLSFSGLSEEASYEVFDYDNQSEILVKKGSELMKNGFDITVGEAPKAAMYVYRIK